MPRGGRGRGGGGGGFKRGGGGGRGRGGGGAGRGRGGGGGRGRAGGGRYWTQPVDDEHLPPRPPPGLRGKEIGLFYRNLQMNRVGPNRASEVRFHYYLTISTLIP